MVNSEHNRTHIKLGRQTSLTQIEMIKDTDKLVDHPNSVTKDDVGDYTALF